MQSHIESLFELCKEMQDQHELNVLFESLQQTEKQVAQKEAAHRFCAADKAHGNGG